MTLANKLLENLNEWRSAEPDRRVISLPGTDWTVTLATDRADELGCKLQEVTVRRATAPERQTLDGWAERICQRTNGLLEALSVYEVDAPRQVALLRSDVPTARGEKLFYYEVTLNGTTQATLRRYQGSREPRSRREQVPFALTHETLANAVQSLTAEQ